MLDQDVGASEECSIASCLEVLQLWQQAFACRLLQWGEIFREEDPTAAQGG